MDQRLLPTQTTDLANGATGSMRPKTPLSRWCHEHLSFYRIHVIYFVLIPIFSSTLFYFLDTNDATFLDALFMTTSASSSAGLETVLIGSLSTGQQVLLFLLMWAGSSTTVALVTIAVRLYFFKKSKITGADKLKHPNWGRKKPTADAQPLSSDASSDEEYTVPEPDTKVVNYLRFDTTARANSNLPALSEPEQAEVGGIEYRALKLLLKVVAVYTIVLPAFGAIVVGVILANSASGEALYAAAEEANNGTSSIAWFTVFQISSAFNNVGLSLIDAGMVPFNTSYLIMAATILMVVSGGSHYPVFIVDVAGFVFLDIGSAAVKSLTWFQQLYYGLFQAVMVHSGGFSVISVSAMTAALQMLYFANMYIGTNLSGEDYMGDKPQAAEVDDEMHRKPRSHLGLLAFHLRWQLSFDIWYIFLAAFLITAFERSKLESTEDTWMTHHDSRYATIPTSLADASADQITTPQGDCVDSQSGPTAQVRFANNPNLSAFESKLARLADYLNDWLLEFVLLLLIPAAKTYSIHSQPPSHQLLVACVLIGSSFLFFAFIDTPHKRTKPAPRRTNPATQTPAKAAKDLLDLPESEEDMAAAAEAALNPTKELDPPKDTPFTTEELKKFDGSVEGNPIYVAIKGSIFDVSAKKEMYGPGGGYHVFAGKDGSRGLGKSSLKPEDAVPDYSVLNESESGVLDDWVKYFTKRYNIVGKVVD
ncbi:cytochrome b5 [Pseudohyphozyma bogoriensis]|nr:cytochrome b5 [Pseudohyphozyma bogoriensis]